jgi:DNA mismatch repair endonuclease MutH
MNSYNEVRQALDPVVGVPFRDLAPVLGISLSPDPRRRKAAGGHLVESLLAIARNSIPRPDLERLGTEVKTLALNTQSRPRENTKVTAFNLAHAKAEGDFRGSTVFSKLRSILFVPVMKAHNDSPDFWYLRPPFLWLPSEEQLEQMDEDYEQVHRSAKAEDWTRLSGRTGRFLTLNTSDSTTAGKSPELKRRAWWLHAELTREVCEENLWPKKAMQLRSGKTPDS